MNYFRRLNASRRLIMSLAIICLMILAYVDWITGPSVSVTCFYLIPVFLLSWYGGIRVGLGVACLHAIVWFALDIEWLPNPSPAIMSWNFAVRFVTFAVVVWLVQLCRNLTGEVQVLNEDKISLLQREVQSRAANEEAVRQLADQLSVAEDAERRRLGQELHDSMGQSLTLLKLRLESLAARLPPSPDASVDVQGSLAILTSVIHQARTLTFELYPSMLDQLGLGTTLRHYAQQLGPQVKAKITIMDSGPLTVLPVPTVCFLFRAAKELINNALKHGAAEEIVVQVRYRQRQVRLVISDDGRGFEPNPAGRTGIGLAWLRERSQTLGGTLSVESSPGAGTRVALELPVAIAPPLEVPQEVVPYGESVAG